MQGLNQKRVFQFHLEIEMIINRKIHVLKGQHILAQGNALGLRADIRIVRAIMFIKEIFLFRTSMRTMYFPEMMSCDSLPAAGRRPKEIICIVHRILTDGFRCFILPRALPWAIIFWPFRLEKPSLMTFV